MILLLDYSYFKQIFKLIVIGLSMQQVSDVDPKAMQRIKFTGNLNRVENTRIYFIIREAKETVLDFSQKTARILWFFFCYNIIAMRKDLI